MIKQFENFLKNRLKRIVWAIILSGLIFMIRFLPGMDYILSKEILLFLIFLIFYFFVGFDEKVSFLATFYLLAIVIISLLSQQSSTAETMANLLFVAFGGLVFKKIINFLK